MQQIHGQQTGTPLTMQFCISCGDPNPSNAGACATCGREVYVNPFSVPIRRCHACRSEVPPEITVCPHCCTRLRDANGGRMQVLIWLIPLPALAAVITLALAQAK